MDDRAQKLYVTTFFWEVAAVVPRCAIAWPVACVLISPLAIIVVAIDPALGDVLLLPVGVLTLVLAAMPLWTSLLALWGDPGGYRLTKTALDGREPEPDEQAVLRAAFAQLGAPRPLYLFVIDDVTPEAYVVGDAVYVTRALIDSDILTPILAHELGHLANGDGRLILALRRFQLPFFGWLRALGTGLVTGAGRSKDTTLAAIGMSYGCFFWVLALAGGGIGLALTRLAWPSYWREREFLADRHAYELGQGHQLIEALRRFEFFDVPVPFHHFVSDHPHVRQRIGRLQRLLEAGEGEPPSATGQERRGEAAETPRDRKRGYTDEEAVLDLVVVDEDHAGWVPAGQIAAEQAWIRANGRRIVDLAHYGNVSVGGGLVSLVWVEDSHERYEDGAFRYMAQDEHADYLNDPTSLATRELDVAMRAAWLEHVATQDAERQVIFLVTSLDGQVRRYGTSHYLVGMRGGDPLPAWGEEPPSRR